MSPALTLAFPSAVEGSHWNEGLLLGRPPEEPEQPLTENSLLEVLDGAVMMYNLSVHQQLGKVSRQWSKGTACGFACAPHARVCRGACKTAHECVPRQDCCQCCLVFGDAGCPGSKVGSLPRIGARLGLEEPG